MAKRRAERGPGRDDEGVKAGVGPPTSAGGNVANHLLGLQRGYGNAAVSTVVQRAPRERPASTDAPWVAKAQAKARADAKRAAKEKAKGKGKKGAPKEESYLPVKDSTITGSPSELMTSAKSMMGSKDPERTAKGFHWMEQAYLRAPGNAAREYALAISRAYKDVGDAKRAAWWMKVQSGDIDPRAPAKP